MPFKRFDKRGAAAASKGPAVTIQRRGRFTINTPAYELLGKPDAVVLLYDEEERLIGFEADDGTDPLAYQVRPLAPNNTSFTVAGQAFAKHHGLDVSTTRRYAVELRDGVLVLDLKSESTQIEGPWTRRQQQQREKTA